MPNLQTKQGAKMKKPLFYFVPIVSILLVIGMNYCTNNSSSESADTQTASVQKQADAMPEVVGGIGAIAENLQYPELAKKAGITGKVIVKAVIDEKGEVVSSEVVKGIGAGCDEAAIMAVTNTKFTPGYKEGLPVKMEITIPVLFKLK